VAAWAVPQPQAPVAVAAPSAVSSPAASTSAQVDPPLVPLPLAPAV